MAKFDKCLAEVASHNVSVIRIDRGAYKSRFYHSIHNVFVVDHNNSWDFTRFSTSFVPTVP
jgi:hypothetical protein